MQQNLLIKYLILLLAFPAFAESKLEVGQCLADPDSKQYLQINTDFNYPKEIQFSCNYTCANQHGVFKLKGKTHIVVDNEIQDARQAVCTGVSVERSPWGGYQFAGVNKFFIYTATSPELTQWAKFSAISLNEASSLLLRLKIKESLNALAESYKISYEAHPHQEIYYKASQIFSKLAIDLPENTMALDLFIKHHQSEINNSDSAEAIVWSAVASIAQWRIQQR